MIKDLLQSLRFGIPTKEVEIGISNLPMGPNAHGIIHNLGEQRVTQHSFVANKPKYLRQPNQEILDSLFNQARKFGLDPQFIEVTVDGYQKVYAPNRADPVFIQRSM